MEVEEISNLIIEEFAKTIEFFGINATEARLFSMLYLKQEPMTLDQMSKTMEKSKTSMSTGIRSLLDLNLVERVWKKGERKDWYQATEDLYFQFMNTYMSKWLEATARQKNSLSELKDVLSKKKETSELHSSALENMNSRLEEMIVFHRLIEKSFRKIKPSAFMD